MCLLQARGMLTIFWVNCSNYLLSMILTKEIWDMIPLKKWSGKNLLNKHLKEFGCVLWDHIPNDKINKLDSKGCDCIMMGYSEELKAYIFTYN
jgi:hypothetical protein